MAAEDVAQVLMLVAGTWHRDEGMREQVAVGNFSAFGPLELSAEERELLRGATDILPPAHEDKVLVLKDRDADVVAHSHDMVERGEAGYWSPGTARAVEYVRDNLADPAAQATFSAWGDTEFDVLP